VRLRRALPRRVISSVGQACPDRAGRGAVKGLPAGSRLRAFDGSEAAPSGVVRPVGDRPGR